MVRSIAHSQLWFLRLLEEHPDPRSLHHPFSEDQLASRTDPSKSIKSPWRIQQPVPTFVSLRLPAWSRQSNDPVSLLRHPSVEGIFVDICAQAVKDCCSQHEDGRAPAQAIPPVELMIALQHAAINELDRIENQGADLQDHWGDRTKERPFKLIQGANQINCMCYSKEQEQGNT